MLTDNCKLVLNKLLTQDKNSIFRLYSMGEIATISGLSFHESIAACKQLEILGYMEILYKTIDGSVLVDSLRLTELGAHYKAHQRVGVKKYLANNWIAFLALLISAGSLALALIN